MRPDRAAALRFIVILGSLTAFAPLSIDMYLPAFPALRAHFGASAGAVQATLAVFFVGLACGQAVYGPISDRYGRRPPLLFGIALYVAASVAAACAPDIGSLTAARLFQALGGCAGMVIARAMVVDLFDERETARVFSLLMLVMGLAPILAPLLGGQFLALFGWTAIFWFFAGFGLLCLAAVLLGLGETLPPERRSAGGIVDALRAYRRLLADRRFVAFAATGALAMGAMFAYITGSPFVFIEMHGVSPQVYGLLFGTNAFGLIVASQINARLLRRFPGQAILPVAVAVALIADLALAAAVLADAGGLVGLMIPLFVTVSSLGFVMANASAAAMARATAHRGAASALIGVMQFALAAGVGALVGALQDGTARPMALVIAALGLAAFVASRIAARSASVTPAPAAGPATLTGGGPPR
jgi:DHA1 family bicyclomycin/chloramphenicol resistance-like MFS transporter